MTDQVSTPEAGAQPQETTSEVENLATEPTEQIEGSEPTESQEEQSQPAPKVVPLAALHEERQRRKEMQAKMQLMEERFGQLAHVVQQRLTPQQQQQRVEEQVPDINTDPIGHFKARTEFLEQKLREQGQTTEEIHRARQAQEMYIRAGEMVHQQTAEFVQQAPDYNDALAHLAKVDTAIYRAMGYGELQAAQMVKRAHDELVINLLQSRQNVPERVYEIAKAKGYAPRAAEAPQAEQKMQQLIAGTKAAKSLGGGGSAPQKLSLAALAEMPAEEFDKATKDEEAWRKMWS